MTDSMPSRRQFLAAAVAGSLAPPASAAPEAAKDLITPAAQRGIEQGLDYLARGQLADGSFGERQYKHNVAVTSLAGLAFMAAGNQPGRGPRGKIVQDALTNVLGMEDPLVRGFFHKPNTAQHGPMYEHGFATLFLAEAHGAVHGKTLRQNLKDKLKRAVELIIHAQNSDGGWRYQPKPGEADLSVTVCQIMALRAARNVGFTVPKSVADKCIEYVKGCQSADGGFRYMKQSGLTRFALTAAGVSALQSAGIYTGPEIERGLKFMQDARPGLGAGRREPDLHYFYGQYYAAQAMWTASGKWWNDWFPAIRDELLALSRARRDDGVWTDAICSHYATAMACIILQIPNNYLSILQK